MNTKPTEELKRHRIQTMLKDEDYDNLLKITSVFDIGNSHALRMALKFAVMSSDFFDKFLPQFCPKKALNKLDKIVQAFALL